MLSKTPSIKLPGKGRAGGRRIGALAAFAVAALRGADRFAGWMGGISARCMTSAADMVRPLLISRAALSAEVNGFFIETPCWRSAGGPHHAARQNRITGRAPQ
ncbi:hypothetical protein [Sphingobium sp.]|uniref:hypothetical protein n=1 Tax=Sphingobium sp. TaxID=1912891 RepID=UPI002D80C8D3|nr:hypothetical protein [Sphingobium sp.]